MANAKEQYNLATDAAFLARIASVVLDAGSAWVIAFDAPVAGLSEDDIQKHNFVVRCRRQPMQAAAEAARIIIPSFTTWDAVADPSGETITDAQIQTAIVADAKSITSVLRKIDGSLEEIAGGGI